MHRIQKFQFAWFGILLASFAVGAESDGAAHPALRVATLNMAHGRGQATAQIGHAHTVYQTNVDQIAATIKAHAPDIVALQEADAPSAWSGGFDHVARIADRATYRHAHHGLHFDVGVGPMRIAYGTAILSRLPITHQESHPFSGGPLHRKGFVTARITFDGNPLTVVSVHLHSGAREVRVEQAREMIDALKGRQRGLIVVGDFNCDWDDPDDALRIIADALDLYAYRPASEALNTFRASAPRKRLDWILISKDLKFIAYANWPEKCSDHLAVEAVIQRRESEQ